MPTIPNPDDPRRPDKVRRYKAPPQTEPTNISEHVNALGMVCSLVGLLLRMKWAAWAGVYCTLIYVANGKAAEDKKQTVSLFMLAMSSLVMVYMQNPSPIFSGHG